MPGVEEAPPGYRPSTSRAPVAPGPDVELALGTAAKAPVSVIGQVLAGYIVCEHAGEVVLVDQHAAHERVLYERLLASYSAGKVASQPLLVPITVAVGGEGAEAVERASRELERLGWEIERFGDADVVVRSVPAIGASRSVPALVERLATELAESEVATAGGALAREVIATIACHAATRVGQRLDIRAAEALIEELGSVDFAASCPHGRPVARRLDRGRIERLFGR
jgi:DNA mismatch repair protein MutL